MKIGDRIREVRKSKGFTQKRLGELAGVSEIAIRNYENHNRQPQTEQLKRLALALDVSLDYLMDIVPQPVTLSTPDGETYENDALIRFPKGHPLYVPTLQEQEDQDAQKEELLENFDSLNPSGKYKAVDYTKDLAVNPLYQRKRKE